MKKIIGLMLALFLFVGCSGEKTEVSDVVETKIEAYKNLGKISDEEFETTNGITVDGYQFFLMQKGNEDEDEDNCKIMGNFDDDNKIIYLIAMGNDESFPCENRAFLMLAGDSDFTKEQIEDFASAMVDHSALEEFDLFNKYSVIYGDGLFSFSTYERSKEIDELRAEE